jgi:HlyD family secretion protein
MKKVYGMNMSLKKSKLFKNKKSIIIFSVIIILSVIFSLKLILGKSDTAELDGPTYEVKRGPLTISFVESGTIKAKEQIIIKNEVEGRTSIISLIPEGTRVKNGDLLVELDASSLEDQKIDQEIRVQNAEASYISSKENLAVAENQAKSDVELAKLTLEFALQDLEKYIQGEYPYELDKAEAEITFAEEELTRARETLKWSQQLYDEKYISQTELRADQIAEKKKALDLQLATKSKDLLTDYTYKRNLDQLKSDLAQAEMAMDRTECKAKADVIQAQANLKAKEAEYQRQKDKLKKIKGQIKKTKIYAPADGLVIYATSAKSGGFRRTVEPLQDGQEIREREELIHLPTGNLSKAEITIHESNLEKIRTGLPAIITADALPGKTFYGTVEHIAPLPDAQSRFMNPDLTVYNSEIYIEGSNDTLRTGMSCQAEIVVQQYQHAIYVPLQAVIRVGSEPTLYIQAGKSFEQRKVKVGLDNNKMIHILEGLDEGEVVLLNPPLKSAAAHSENSFDIPDKTSTEKINKQYQQITERLKKVGREEPVEKRRQPSDSKLPLRRGKKQGFENIDPEKREMMRKQFQEMSPEERKKLRQKYRGTGPEG